MVLPTTRATDPVQRARLLAQIREAVLAGAPVPQQPRPLVFDSWRRSLAARVDPECGAGPPTVYQSAEMAEIRAEHPLSETLPLLRETLVSIADEAVHMMIVTDAEGHILWREGRQDVLRRADKVGLIEGTRWSEDAIGTNAMGTALAEGVAVQIHSAEHLVRAYQSWTCAASPVRDPDTGRIIGVVDVTGPVRSFHPSTAALVGAAAKLAESHLRVRMQRRDELLRVRNAPQLAALRGDYGALVTPSGRVLASHPHDWLPVTRVRLDGIGGAGDDGVRADGVRADSARAGGVRAGDVRVDGGVRPGGVRVDSGVRADDGARAGGGAAARADGRVGAGSAGARADGGAGTVDARERAELGGPGGGTEADGGSTGEFTGRLMLPDGRPALLEPVAGGYLLRLDNRRSRRLSTPGAVAGLSRPSARPTRPATRSTEAGSPEGRAVDPAVLELRFLGFAPTATLNGRRLRLTQRHADMLTLLALHPPGVTAEQLATGVYGERGNPVTARAEIHRLRAQLGADVVRSGPYRLEAELVADFLQVREELSAGRVRAATQAYRGELRPASEAPAITEERELLAATLRRAVLDAGDVESMWLLAETDAGGDDLELAERLTRALAPSDPRHATMVARSERLAR
jgi:hypothetical protein